MIITWSVINLLRILKMSDNSLVNVQTLNKNKVESRRVKLMKEFDKNKKELKRKKPTKKNINVNHD